MKNCILFLLALCLLARPTQAQITPDELSGLELWLKSDAGITTELSTVVLWEDQSGNDRDASTFAAGLRPIVVDDVLNGYPAVRFDGYNDFLDFAEVNNIRTVFWLIREDPDADIAYPRCLLGHFAQADFLRGPSKVMWHPTLSAPEVRDGITRVNFAEVDGTMTTAPTDYSIVSLVTTGDCAASSLTVDRLLYERVWDGDIFEVILYSEALSPEEVEQVELYLANKYGPAFSVTDDVQVEDNFCPVSICASEGFESYAWSTGSDVACVEVNNTGDYSVTAVDLFGRVLSDTIHVQYPGNTAPDDQLICMGEAWTWETGLDASYTLSWPDGSQGLSFTTSEEGMIDLVITDGYACVLETDVWIDVDEFPVQVSLGPDLQLCSGNGIHITDNSAQPSGYLWSDGTEQNVMIVQESGEYSLIATNDNGCMAYDTIQVEVVGISPPVEFNLQGMCAGAPVTFEAVNLSSDEIVSWTWEFGDGGDIGGTVEHTYSVPGEYLVTVIGEAITGCVGTFEAPIQIHEPPVAGYLLPQVCTNELAVFQSNASSVDGEITSYSWIIDATPFAGQEVVAGPFDAGFHSVVLTVETEYGCVDEVEGVFQVLMPPIAGILVQGQCEGDITYFDSEVDITGSGPVTNYQWDFGDGGSSGLVSPSHFYVFPGTYFTSLTVVAANGCSDTTYIPVEISETPLIDFNTGNACVGEVFPIGAQVLSGHTIESYQWTVNGVESAAQSYILPIFETEGFQVVMLEVITDLGCEASVQQLIPVWPDAVAVIAESPEIGQAPLLGEFSAAGSSGVQFQWDFGDGATGSGSEVVHEYASEGSFDVSLVVTNTYGCSDTAAASVLVAVPVLDLVTQEVNIGDFTPQIEATIVNHGNVIVKRILLSWQQGGDSPVTEVWEGSLLPGNSLIYQFNSWFTAFESNEPYLCVTTVADYPGLDEQNPADNLNCISSEPGQFGLYTVFPNPASEMATVRYFIPKDGDVEIGVHDQEGRLVQQWEISGSKAGVQSLSLDVGTWSSGVYTVSVLWNGSTESSTMLVRRP